METQSCSGCNPGPSPALTYPSVFCEHPGLLRLTPQELLCPCLETAESESSLPEASFGKGMQSCRTEKSLVGDGDKVSPLSAGAL